MDDIEIHRINTGLFAYPAILVGHQLGLFELLTRPRTLVEIAGGLKLAERSAEAILGVAIALGFVTKQGDVYGNSAMATQFIVRDSPTSWASYLDSLIENAELWSFAGVRDCLVHNEPQMYAGREAFAVNAQDPGCAARYTRWMHSVSQGPASAWPAHLDLSQASVFLDIAGGSGVHAIAAARAFPGLRCVVADLPTVGDVARAFISGASLDGRVTVVACDMWKDPLPAADVHFYSQIFHDWSLDECLKLARRSCEALPAGGLLVVHELLMNDDRTGPEPAVVVNLIMRLMYATGAQYSGRELEEVLRAAGFSGVERIPTYGHWNLVVGRKDG